MALSVPFLEIFSACAGAAGLCGGLEKASVSSVVITRADSTMEVQAFFPAYPAPGDLSTLEQKLASAYDLASVRIHADYPREEIVTEAKSDAANGGKDPGSVLFGRPIREKSIDIGELTLDTGSAVVTGEVFATDSRKIVKNNAAVLSFFITDHTGSIHVSRYFKPDEDQSVIGKIRKHDRVTVRGSVVFNRYDNDLALEPTSIARAEPVVRKDLAEGEKRVELHLHTRFSALDALTDTKKAVQRAAAWGHRAIAVTDHGVAQAFPDLWHAGKECGIKVIYGIEGYYLNDVDDSPAVRGGEELPADTDFVGFDVETTGLDCGRDRLIEIGAVRYSGGEAAETFRTFVDPGRPIPAKSRELSGISDEDVAGAPKEDEALRDFLRFAGGLPLVAHNAAFDAGFLSAAAERSGIEFRPVLIDTLPLSQALVDSRSHKLEVVARHLGVPEGRYHRALDDAAVCARVFVILRDRLCKERGITRLGEITPAVTALRGIKNRRAQHITLLVKDKTGLKNLYKLITRSHLEYFHKNPVIPKSLLAEHREGLLIGSACAAGEVFSAIARHHSPAEVERLASFYDYLEIMPLCNNRFLIDEGMAEDDEALRDLNRRVLALGRKLGKPVCATGDVHFLDPDDEIYRHILLASKKMSDADRELPLYFKTTDEMLAEFAYLGEEEAREVVIAAPNRIADEIGEFELLPKQLFPPSIPNAAEDLQRLVWDRAHELYGEDPPAIVADRVKEELDAILGRHYEVIYMSAQKLVQNSLEHGYLVGSRGSVGSSMVAYLSGITEVNSLPPHYRCPKCRCSDFEHVYNEAGEKYGCGADMPDRACPACGTPMKKDGFDIPFETFLGFGGDKVPDIDLNFSGEYQASAHKYTEELFGSDHVFRAGTIGTLAEKTAYGYVKKYLEERGLSVSKAEENRLAAGCINVKRTTGQHPGGLVIIPQDMDVTDFCPVQHPADDSEGGIITTHFEYHCMEANLLKLDELGHDDPTMIRMLEDLTGVNAREIPLDDPETMRIFTTPAPLGLGEDDPVIGKTGTIGVPEFGTPFTRQMLVDTQPTEFATLVRLSGFSHGTDVWAGNIHDIVVNGIAPTDKCVGCRDDIMLYLISCGMEPRRAFKFMEAVRKGNLHKGKPWPEGIEEEMKALNVPEWWVESCRKIQYLFPKAHAVAYVIMAFRIAWFKVHEPLAYYSAYFYRRSQKDSFDADSMLHGIDVCRSRINAIRANPAPTAKEEDLLTTLESVYEFYLRGFSFLGIDIYRSDAYRFLPENGKLRAPFVAVSGLGGTAAEDLVKAREKNGGPFASIEDVADLCPKVTQAHREALRRLGAFGDLPDERQLSFF